MSVIPLDNAHMVQMLQNDAQRLRSDLSWLIERNTTWQLIGSGANLTAAGITGSDQTAVLALLADIARTVAYMTGTPQAIAGDIRQDIVNVIGVM